jgi:hypothetical protein
MSCVLVAGYVLHNISINFQRTFYCSRHYLCYIVTLCFIFLQCPASRTPGRHLQLRAAQHHALSHLASFKSPTHQCYIFAVPGLQDAICAYVMHSVSITLKHTFQYPGYPHV